MARRWLCCMCFSTAVVLWLGCSNAAPTHDWRSETATVDRYLTNLAPFGFSGSILVADRNDILLEGYYGTANTRTGAQITANTRFDIASLSKSFTAIAIMRLQEQGKLKVTDTLTTHFSDVPDWAKEVTIHQLLTHTSGLIGLDNTVGATPQTQEEAVKVIFSSTTGRESEPYFQYANDGYVLLAAIIERVSGAPFETFLRKQIFVPAGMQQTGFWWEPRWKSNQVAHGIGAYEGISNDGDPRHRPFSWLVKGPGGILSTVSDLYRWHRALLTSKVLRAESVRRIRTPQTQAEADFLHYGYGMRIQQTPRQTNLVWHTGWDEAFSAVYRHYTEEHLTIIFLSNASQALIPMREIVLRSARPGVIGELLFDDGQNTVPDSYPVSEQDRRRLLGHYTFGDNARFELAANGDRMLLIPQNAQCAASLDGVEDLETLQTTTKAAEELLKGIAGIATVPVPDFTHVDPLGFAHADAATIADRIHTMARNNGAIQAITGVATAQLEGLRGPRLVSWVQIRFGSETVDYCVIWFAEDEVYVLDRMPEIFARPLRWDGHHGWFTYDLLSGRQVSIAFDGTDDALTIHTPEADWRSQKASK